jgi:large subunit ribosomal protein L9
MLVILRENVENLGRIGDVVRVSSGYARNFLLPRKMVEVASEKNVSQIDHKKRALEKRRLQDQQNAQELAKKLSDFSCNISRKVGQQDKLFGSVGTADIAEELKTAGFEIEKRQIQLEDNIKTLGVHPVTIKLHPEVEATVKVWVVKNTSEE